ncbi:MAG: sugar phosphate isomerase/epimerase family protein [Oscillospiraceae bacterium]
MKLSFSTLGCPSWSLDEVFSAAKDLGFDGVEIRGISDKIYVPDFEAFKDENLQKTKNAITKINLKIPVLDSGAVIADHDKAQNSFAEACDYINLASKLGVKYVRVMGTGEPQVTDGNFERAAQLYGLLCEYASIFGVTPLIETNGKLADSKEMIKLMEQSGNKNCGVVWDVHHTVRFASETPEQTAKDLGSLIKHVHLKDSVVSNGNIEYKMMGYGDMPIKKTIEALREIDFDGFVSLEWVKRWKPDLQEPGIVFAHFASYMRALLN